MYSGEMARRYRVNSSRRRRRVSAGQQAVQPRGGSVERADREPHLVVLVPLEHERLLAAHDRAVDRAEGEADPPGLFDREDHAQLAIGIHPAHASLDRDRGAGGDIRRAVGVEALVGLRAARGDGIALGVEADARVHRTGRGPHVLDVQSGAALRGPRQQRVARRLEPDITAADAPGLLGGDAALRRILHEIGRLRRPDGGVVDRLVIERSAAHAIQPTSRPCVSTSPDSAAMNASWGTSTRPTIFMRFLPSFCFSSSLRLRLMSPP